MECARYHPGVFPSLQRDKWHVVLAQFSPLALDVTLELLQKYHNVLLIVSQGNNKLSMFYEDVMKFSKQLVIVKYDTEFLGDNFSDLVSNRNVSHIHIVFSEYDFSALYSVEARVGPLRKTVGVLEYLSNHQNIVVLDHVHILTNDLVLYNIRDTAETIEAVPEIHYTHNQFRALKYNESDEQMFHRMCILKMDYIENHDVFIKALDTYLFTFHSLYNIQMQRIIHLH